MTEDNTQFIKTIEAARDAVGELNAGLDADAEALARKMHIENLIREAVEDGRKLVTVRVIDAINDIPGADLIKVAQVEGWQVVVKAGEFQVGDLCVFFEVDAFVQLSDERFSFLEKNAITWQGIRGARLKTIRLRKQLSQGLALPLSLFPEIEKYLKDNGFGLVTYLNIAEVRQINFTGVLGVMKWEKVMSAQLAGQAKGNFPSFLRKSDQERAQNMGDSIFMYEDRLVPFDMQGIPAEAIDAMTVKGELRHDANGTWKVLKARASRDTRYEVSIKLDGSSATGYVRNDPELKGVCSRNLDLKMEGNEDNAFVKIFTQPDVLELIAEQGGGVALQGELMGPGIQGNREGLEFNRFFLYNIFDIERGDFMTPQQRLDWVEHANKVGSGLFGIDEMITQVPILHYNVTLAELGITNMAELLKFAEGPSLKNNVREGLVFKAMDGSHQFKVISNLYLEQEK